METSDIITNSEVLNRLFNGNTTKGQFNRITSDFETVTVKLW